MIIFLLILVVVALAIACTMLYRSNVYLRDDILSITNKNNLEFRRGFDTGWETGHREGERRKEMEWLLKTKSSTN